MATRLKETDVVVVGLGAAGGVAVLPLTQAGIDVVGLEAGTWLTRKDFAPDELQGKIVPDEHPHEHATCYNVKDRGLVVITSCGHAGIINTVRQAQEVSGVNKLHALVGGFHLGPAPVPYIAQAVAELKALEPDVIVPMHCSGLNFAQAVREQQLRTAMHDHDHRG